MSRWLNASRLWDWLSLATCVLMIAAGAALQSHVHLNHDVAWIMHGARWMLDGAQFGRDIIDVNPPLIWFVSLPAAWTVNAGLFTEAEALRGYVWLLCGASLLLCRHVLRPMRARGEAAESACLLVGAAFAMAMLPAAVFGQREHFAFVLGIPYCLLIAARLRADEAPTRAVAIACGVMGGIAFGFKPWFLAVPLLLELVHLASTRALRSVWRAETVALAATLFAYLLALLAFAPEYPRVVVPMAVDTYWAYDGSLPAWIHWRTPAIAACVALAFLGIARRFPAPAMALFAAFAGFSFSHWAQRKGFAYHAYPAMACAVTLLAFATLQAARALSCVRWPIGGWLKVAMAACAVIVGLNLGRLWYRPVSDWARVYDMDGELVGGYRSRLIARINATVPRDERVYAFSTHPFPAFPTMSYTAAEWGSPMAAQFAIPALLMLDQVKDPEARAAVERAVQAQRDQVVQDFERHPPTMVLVTTGPGRLGMHDRDFDDLAFYTAETRFAAIWRQYSEAEPFGSMRVFLRRGSATSQPASASNTK
jgi:hypothetical protein